MGRSPIWIKVYAPIWCPNVYRREHLIHVYIAAQMYIIRIRQKRRGYYEMWIHNHFWLLRLFFFPIILKKKNKKNNFRKKFDTYIFRQKTSSSGWLGTLSRFDIDVIERRESRGPASPPTSVRNPIGRQGEVISKTKSRRLFSSLYFYFNMWAALCMETGLRDDTLFRGQDRCPLFSYINLLRLLQSM